MQLMKSARRGGWMVALAATAALAVPQAAGAAPYLSQSAAGHAAENRAWATFTRAAESNDSVASDVGTHSCTRLSRSSFYCTPWVEIESEYGLITCMSDYRVTKTYGRIRASYVPGTVDCS